MDTSQARRGLLTDLTADECWDLAASRPVGRLAWTGPQGLTVVPVNYVVSDRRVHVRTAAYSALARECDDSDVAFQIDQFDTDNQSGWSVLLRGKAHVASRGSDTGNEPDVWPTGARALQVTVDVQQVSGRRVS
jgi:nitroimidazol reductase NimA-like FMN-containing flavoprotein (pyridoxamine 5'-phosphate oxidase superfamily)